jgi:acyl dehydratase
VPIDPAAAGRQELTTEVAWATKDALLYALGVGAGHGDPTDELAFTTENSENVGPLVLPTFGTVIAHRPGRLPDLGDYDFNRGLHRDQSLLVHRPIPLAGRAMVTTRIVGLYDEGWGAIIETEAVVTPLPGGEPLLTSRMGIFVRGAGRFGGVPAPVMRSPVLSDPPEIDVVVPTRPEQALIYRLSGDDTPLHSDPVFAARYGFRRPILHGLCTYGITGRVLLHHVCGSDPARFQSMSARFVRPVLPGQVLRVLGWCAGRECRFRTVNEKGLPVLDFGILRATD